MSCLFSHKAHDTPMRVRAVPSQEGGSRLGMLEALQGAVLLVYAEMRPGGSKISFYLWIYM